MTRRVGGNPAKTRLLPGLAFPIGISDLVRVSWATLRVPTAGAAFNVDAAQISLLGSLIVSGDIQSGSPFDIAPGQIALAAQIAITGDVQFIQPAAFDLQTTPVALAGALSITGDIDAPPMKVAVSWAQLRVPSVAVQFDIDPAAPVAMFGAISVSGDIRAGAPWEFESPLTITQMAGALSVAGDLQFVSPASFDLVASPIALLGAASVSGDIELSTSFDLQPTSPIAMAAAAALLGDIQFEQPVLFDVDCVAPVALTGLLTVQGDIGLERSFDVQPAGAVVMSGALTASGDIRIERAFDLVPLAAIGLTGIAAILGDIQAVTPVPFDVQQSGSIAMAGELLASGDVQATVPFDLAAGTVAMSGAMGIAGDINAGGPFDLSGGEIALLAALGIAGNIQIRVPATVPDVTGLSREDAEAALQGAGFLVAVSLVLSTEVPVNHVISQDPPPGTASFVGTTVDIVVSQYDVAKVIGGNKNVRFRPVKKRRQEKEPQTAAPRAKASGLLKGLLARIAPPPLAAGLEIPLAPLVAEVVAEAVAEVAPQPSNAVEEQEVSELEQLRRRVDALTSMVTEITGELQQLRQAHGPQALPALRDPLDDALVALLPAVREPLELEPEEPAGLPELTEDEQRELSGESPAAPAPAATAPPAIDIQAENRRRAELLARSML